MATALAAPPPAAIAPAIPGDPLDRIGVLLPRGQTIRQVLDARRHAPFAPAVTDFIQQFGQKLRTSPAARAFPELVALGYWARKANIARLAGQFTGAYPGTVRRPRGVAFHVAPANVDTIFVYSLLLSMLAGNVNIVRVSSRDSDQSSELVSILGAALADADPRVSGAIAIVQYGHDAEVTARLSQLADTRIVWGGDATVSLIREAPLRPNGVELVFPNKFSFAVFDADTWLAEAEQDAVARRFANDSLWFGQAACSSPRLVAWLGSDEAVAAARGSFWPAVERAAQAAGFTTEPAQAVAKLIAEQELAIAGGSHITDTSSNRVRTVFRAGAVGFGDPASAGDGFFTEYHLAALDDLASMSRPDWQTIVSYGISSETWADFLTTTQPRGIDRIVPVGQALDFDRLWDGMDLLAAMTKISVLP